MFQKDWKAVLSIQFIGGRASAPEVSCETNVSPGRFNFSLARMARRVRDSVLLLPRYILD
jgi:hypothetical protein